MILGLNYFMSYFSFSVKPRATSIILVIFFSLIFVLNSQSQAASGGQTAVGFGYFSHNAFFQTTHADSGAPSILGNAYFPLVLRHDISLGTDSFFSPRLIWTPLADDDPDDVETSFLMLDMAYVKNWNAEWDWSLGLAFFRYSLKGPGGSVVLDNGTGTATFGRPGREVTINQFLISATTSRKMPFGDVLCGLYMTDLISEKRAISFMLSVQFNLGGIGL
jgi:hypothetical protein